MDIKPLYTEADYEEALNELMSFEAQGLLTPTDFFYIEVMIELLDAFNAKHDPKLWCEGHYK
jgi:hypothetical protein